ncbi:myo-inosose-2 dehydratase [Sansalvadorimonas sp. 2012CJ34-2]|uniref:Myo-inosose-2 dehydratase n=1 Tax=Parendozoicomonas callyspongiae TaxID=2942213 RepID=A0ABT0PEB4_9GAMM|nr:myo-inosose-2 dehydratase [Sansalvadorimonas sp. 2012CJ34-2]MCL6269650.1 myo-inosose-2 dehydratase [Sansalvadorimonas sp. 2012CJ34-2]
MSNVKLGINPLTWTNDDMPSLGAETPLETCLAESREAGFAGVELGNKFPRKAEVLKPILAEFDRELVSGWYSAELLTRSVEAEIEAVQDHLALLKACGCPVMVVCEVTDCIHGAMETPLTRRPVMAAEKWEEFGKRMTEFGDYLKEQGVHLAYHHHMGTVVQTEEEVNKLMEVTDPSVGLLLDTGHLTFAGGDPVRCAAKWGDRIVHVHTKDVRAEVLDDCLNRDLPFLKSVLQGVFTVPGDGSVDYNAVLAEMKKVDYHGWLVVEAEQDPAIAHPLTYATMGYKNLKAIVDATGL